MAIVPFWLISLFFVPFKLGTFVISVGLCALSVLSFVIDLYTMKYFSDRGDVDAAYEWFTAVVAMFDLLIAIAALGGSTSATEKS